MVIMIFTSKHVYQGLKINRPAVSHRIKGLKIMHRSLSMAKKRDINININNARNGSKVTITSTDPITASLVQDIQGILGMLQVQDISNAVNNQFNAENNKYTISSNVRSSGTKIDSTVIRDSIPDVTLDVSKSLSNMLLNHHRDKHTTDKSTEVKDDEDDDDDDDSSSDDKPVELGWRDNDVLHLNILTHLTVTNLSLLYCSQCRQ